MADGSEPIALVTGAAHGIGLEVCRQLAGMGWTVVLTARGATVAVDVTADDGPKRIVDAAVERWGRVDVLINNAAMPGDWSETPGTADLRVAHAAFETNLFGPWRVIQAFLPLLRRSRRGRIVNVSSGAGAHGDAEFGVATGAAPASYSASKAALNALTVKLAIELLDERILVNAVCPGLTATAPGMEAMGARPVEQGAAGVVWAATLEDGGPTGGFFRDGQPIGW